MLLSIRACLTAEGGFGMQSSNDALRPLAGLPVFRRRVQDCPDSLIEDGLQSLLRESGTLQVFHCPDVTSHLHALSVLDRHHATVPKLLNGRWVFSQIKLGANQDDRRSRSMVRDFRVPLGPDVLITRGAHKREADEEHVSLGVGEWSKSVIILLSGSIPETERYGLAVDHNICRVVIEHGRDILAREGIRCVRDEKTCLPYGTITHNDTLNGLHSKRFTNGL